MTLIEELTKEIKREVTNSSFRGDRYENAAQAAKDVVERRLFAHDTIMSVCKHPMSAAMTEARVKAIWQAVKEGSHD